MTLWLLLTTLWLQVPPSTAEVRPPKPKLHTGAPPTPAQISAAREKAKARGLMLAGVHVPVDAKALAKGSWHKLGGRAVWMLQVESPGAQALRVQFRDCHLGQGQLWVHAAGERDGPYTGRGPNGDGEFWSGTIHSAKVIIEFLPEGQRPAKVPFNIAQLSHQF